MRFKIRPFKFLQQLIEHTGVVQTINDNKIIVQFVSYSACSQCGNRIKCNMAESEMKTVEVCDKNNNYQIGDNVVVLLEQSKGYLAILLVYFIPVLILFTTIILVHTQTHNDVWAALFSLLSLAVYYVILYFFRNKLNSKYNFKLKKTY